MIEKKPFLMGMSAWGGHIDTFLEWTLPSLMANGNLPALRDKYRVLINIHTDRDGRKYICDNLPFVNGVDFRIMTDANKGDDKYAQLGSHQNSDLCEAKRIGADYHLLMPDFVYSHDFFVGVLKCIKRGHKAIARLVLSTCARSAISELEKYRAWNVISVPAADLATIGLRNIHPRIKHWFVEGDKYPNIHVVAWKGEFALHMHSPHCSPVYIANEAILIPNCIKPLDSILNQAIDSDIYCTSINDGIVAIEISLDNEECPDQFAVGLNEFCRIIRENSNNSEKQLAVFKNGTVDPICRDMLEDVYLSDIEIVEAKQTVYYALENN